MFRAFGFDRRSRKPQLPRLVLLQLGPPGAQSKERCKQESLSRQREWLAATRRERWWDQGQNSLPNQRTRRQSSCRCSSASVSSCHLSPAKGLAPEFPAAWRRSCSKTLSPPRCLFGSLRKSLSHPTERFILASLSKYANAPEKVSFPRSLNRNGSILQKLLYRRRKVAGLRKDHVLQLGLVRAESVHGRNAPNRGV